MRTSPPTRARTAPRGSSQRAIICALMFCALVLGWPTAASAWVSPTLVGPPGDASAPEGASTTFTWSGSLQGDPAGLSRSYFLLQVAKTSVVPSGTQSVWPTVATSAMSTPGEPTTSLSIAVPDAGTYSWRICAWGVSSNAVDASLAQLACSNDRMITTTVDAGSDQSSGTIGVPTTVVVPGPTTTVTQERIVELPAADPGVRRIPVKRAAEKAATFRSVEDSPAAYGQGESSSVSLDNSSNTLQQKPDTGAFASLAQGLGATIPGIPIPYWSLSVFLIAMFVTWLWRKSLIAMFEQRAVGRRGDHDELGELTDLDDV